MTFSANIFLSQRLQKRREHDAFRQLQYNDHLIDFCSNDYLGFARSEELKYIIENECAHLPLPFNGSTGSRLLKGNSLYAENLERKIARYHNAEAGLIYNSGFDANLGLFSAIGKEGDTIIYDELIHASARDGIKLSTASSFPFNHNDLDHLEKRLEATKGVVYIAIETVYSMDGDYAPLLEITSLCEKYNANLIIDEAHATGVTANDGRGLAQQLSLEKKIFARVHTFGKALGCHGAIVLGSNLLRDFLINFSRSFIYTTALPVKSLVAVNQAYQMLVKKGELIISLQKLIHAFKSNIRKDKNIELIESNTPIQCIVKSGNSEIKKLALQVQKEGFDVRPILSPTVIRGRERLRICIHAFNTIDEVERLVDCIRRSY